LVVMMPARTQARRGSAFRNRAVQNMLIAMSATVAVRTKLLPLRGSHPQASV
jgi:hypothetical protein